ncbi:deoxynucleoside kinase [Streptomyces sp. TRM76323]|uniref:Deoxynucleoside kinase n=1 Tax=Streptomyces tamarix TaxID=3078565 RepID=A0ABU3QL07_9ACTN|nr:deoxynucleoside kinase [Streptomyces tamarix]MDT9683432.1 deoxynucleoside kinase [Streptomyces tamarix]
MTVITISAPVGSGKTSIASYLGKVLETPVYYEPVSEKDNPILKLYYKDQSKYGFLQQIFFLNKRFSQIKKAYETKNAIIDSSIYTDDIFLHRLYKDGKVTEQEVLVYEDLFNNIMEEIDGLPYKKKPDLMISIDLDIDTELDRIYNRGRGFEQDDSLKEYWQGLLDDYKAWISTYDLSPVYVIDGNKDDFVNDKESRNKVITEIIDKLQSIGQLSEDESNKAKSRISSL